MNDEVIQLVQNAQSLATISHNIWTIGMLAIFICIPIEIIALGFSRKSQSRRIWKKETKS